MTWIAQHVWLIPLMPLIAAGIIAVTRRAHRRFAAGMALSALAVAFGLSVFAFLATLQPSFARTVVNTTWFTSGQLTFHLGWVIDPLSAAMLLMITFVGSLIFAFSTGYMAEDANFTRFFGFLSLFAAAMLGLVVANSLLVLFVCWELVGLASYLLIGFWFTKPSAAAAAKKAFITTRVGDLGLFTAMLWLNAETGTLLFYDAGRGILEADALSGLLAQTTILGLTASSAIGLLAFWGAIGKSGQLPLHVWLPDAMEGPTPVSALIHAATMVAAGVFLVARLFPLLSANLVEEQLVFAQTTPSLIAIAWVGAVTAVFAAFCAVAQSDLKRVLAYSTMSQLGLMFVGVATAGPAVGIIHLLAHAFFKALLFLGAGSVIHACNHEQDLRRLGGLRRILPVTFTTYAIGMMALSGVPVFFAGFWSKDAVVHGALTWPVSHGPFILCVFGAALTAFYMTRQMCFVFFGEPRTEANPHSASDHPAPVSPRSDVVSGPFHESPRVMTIPLVILAISTILLSALCTPFWPWLEHYLGVPASDHSVSRGVWAVLALSSVVSLGGIALAWWIYRPVRESATSIDPVAMRFPRIWNVLAGSFGVDALYAATIRRAGEFIGRLSAWLDRWLWEGLVDVIRSLGQLAGWVSARLDETALNAGFDQGCELTRHSGERLSWFHNGRAHRYLRILAMGVTVLGLLLFGWMQS